MRRMIKMFIAWLISLFKTPQTIHIRKTSNKPQSLKDWEKQRKKLYKQMKSA